MDRFWLLTWTTYGTWLPGDARGFVGRVREKRILERLNQHRVEHDLPGTEYDADLPRLEEANREQLRGAPVRLSTDDAHTLMAQFRATAEHRGWSLLAAAVMSNHVHLVVGVLGDPDPATLLRDFKSYGSRSLTALNGSPTSGTWWTKSGSRRRLPNHDAVQAAVEYVRKQMRPLALCFAESPAGTEG